MNNILLFILLLTSIASNIFAQPKQEQLLNKFFEKDSVVILVTDSGLGGMSVAANLYEKIKDAGIFENVKITFFNAQPHLTYGYNSMKTLNEKIWVFDNALEAIDTKLKPDIILIACNTLSVIYEYTRFSKNPVIPVIGIVDAGVDLIKSNMGTEENSKVIIFATKTTIDEAKHKTGLIEEGIAEERIITIACPRLAGSIERNYNGPETDSLLNGYIGKGIEQLGKQSSRIFVSYNCTHYGYITDQFASKFDELGIDVTGYLDPNYYMADFIFNSGKQNRFENTEISIEIISQPEITPEKIYSIYSLLEKTSGVSAGALLYYNYEPDFFNWRYEENN